MAPAPVHIDYETASAIDLTKVGLWRYAKHPSTRVLILRYRFGNEGPVLAWKPGDEPPWDLIAHIEGGGQVIAHNAAFERMMTNVVLPRMGESFGTLTVQQMNCTMSRVQALGLPGSLGQAAVIVGARHLKDEEGSALMKRVCKPRKIHPDGRIEWWWEDASWPEKEERLGLYCDDDVRAETAVDLAVPQLTAQEREIWEFDQLVNERGVKMDRFIVQRCIDVVEVAKRQADARMKALTDGAVGKVSETGKLLKWFQDRGIPAKSMAKGEHDEIIGLAKIFDDPVAKDVMELRRDTNKTSTGKFPKMLDVADPVDDRMRFLLQYHGAATGRWAGRLVQPQNFPRVDGERDLPVVLAIIDLLKGNEDAQTIHDVLEAIYGEVMPWMAKMLRACLIADEGKEFIGGDLSNIEGRVNAWLAGERWKIEAFAAYDAGTGPDLYNLAYSRSFGVDLAAVTKSGRQIGKVQELACGYQGSVGAWVSMAANYKFHVSEIVGPVRAAVSSKQWDDTAAKYDRRNAFGMPEDWWTACKIVVDNWRQANSAIMQSWWDLQDAAIEAVSKPNVIVPVLGGRVRYMHTKGLLLCALPDNSVLTYWRPRVVETGGEVEIEVFDDEGNVIDVIIEKQRVRRQVVFEGMNSKTKKWGVQSLYGGLQCENVVQKAARQILCGAMKRIEAAGYPIVLTVHDETLSEVPAGYGSVEEYVKLMSQGEPWAPGLPLNAAAWRDTRYVK